MLDSEVLILKHKKETMTKYYSYSPICVLILIGSIITLCNGQEKTAKPLPEIIGTPPIITGQPGPINDPTLVSQYIRSIFQDSKGNYWFGPAGQSAVRYDGKTLRYFSRNEFFQGNSHVAQDYGNSVHAIAEDKKGNIWFGTYDGAVKYDGATFRSYTEKDGLSNLNVGRKCILVDKAGTIWVGTSGGVFRYNHSADNFSPFHLLGSIKVKDIMEDEAGNIWFASEGKGVFRYDARLPARPAGEPDGQGKKIKNFTEKEGLGDNYAGGMAQDKAGNFWFLMKNGICRYDGKNFIEITAKDGLGGSEFWGILIEKSGIIWVTARGATTRYDPSIPTSNPKAFTVFTPEDGLNCCVQSMYQDRSSNMWWGTGQGLYRFDGKHFYQVKQKGPW
jgi:ligand-binding sensor domain-containing protein